MADKIRIEPDELAAQGAALEGLSKRMEAVERAIGIIGGNAWNATGGGVGITHDLLVRRVGAAASTIQVGANLAKEAARDYKNVDAVIRGHVESDTDNAYTQYLRDTVSDSVMKEPVSQQRVSSPWMDKWAALKDTPGYKQGDHWDGKCKAYGGSGCFAMAHMMQAQMCGITTTEGDIWPESAAQFKVGDAVHYFYKKRHDDGTVEDMEHWIFIYKVNADTIEIGEGNFGIPGTVNYQTVAKSKFGKFDSAEYELGEIHRVL